jgi:DNA-directed RNA polymerase specialized sigma24 family protein
MSSQGGGFGTFVFGAVVGGAVGFVGAEVKQRLDKDKEVSRRLAELRETTRLLEARAAQTDDTLGSTSMRPSSSNQTASGGGDTLPDSGAVARLQVSHACLQALSSCSVPTCDWQSSCPIDAACGVAQLQGIGESRDLAHELLLEVCLNAELNQDADVWKRQLLYRAKRRPTDLWRSARAAGRAYCELGTNKDAFVDFDERGLPHLRILLHGMLCQLDPTDRCVVEARWLYGMDDEAVARQCGVPSAVAVRQRDSRAHLKMRQFAEGKKRN